MNKIEQLMEKYLTPFAVKLGNIKGLIAIRDGVSLAMPLIIGGSIFLIINSFPVPGWPEFLATLLDGKLSSMLNHIVNSTFGLMGLIATFGIARSMAQQYNVDGASAGVIAMSAWLILTPNIITDTAEGVPVSYLGSKGLFIGIVVGLVSAWIFKSFVLKNIVIKMPDSVPPAVSKSFSALIPGVVVFFLAGVVALLIDISPFENAHELLATILAVPLGFIGGTLPGAIIVVALNSLFWFVGIHGGNVVGSVTNPIFLANTDENRLALQAGKELPHIITTQFFDMFAYIGGGGAVFGLAITLLFFGKSSQSKAMKGIAVTPNIFNISEPIMFGMPVMLNMSYLIPFVLAPIVNVLITYFSMSVGLVHKTIGVAVPWTTPPIISGWLATGSWTGAGLQIVLILIDMAIYLPFFLAADRAQRQGLEI